MTAQPGSSGERFGGLTVTRRVLAGIETSVMVRAGPLPPLVFLHGLVGQSEIWLAAARHLDSGHALFIPDLVGRGESELPVTLKPANIYQAMVAQVVALIDEWDLKNVTLIGGSLGALVAGLTSLERPARVSRLVLANSEMISNPRRRESVSHDATVRRAGIFQAPVTIDDLLVYLAGNVVTVESLDPTYVIALLRTLNRPAGQLGIRRVVEMIRATAPTGHDSFFDRAGEVTAQTALIWGDRDARASVDAGSALAARIAGARIDVCADCGHFPFQENAALFARSLTSFCATAPLPLTA